MNDVPEGTHGLTGAEALDRLARFGRNHARAHREAPPGFVLPATPLASRLGFTPLPAAYLVFVAGATAMYLGLVDVAKRQLVGRLVSATPS
jgi:hypothetical protein